MIPIAKPSIGTEEIFHVQQVLKSGNIASGQVVSDFENDFATYFKMPYGVATSSGTTALHAAIIACNIKKGDKIITTPFTFAATANSLLFEGAIPIFADIDPNTFNIDVNHVEELLKVHKDIKGILIVHLFGLPCNMDRIMELVKKYNLLLIEDCAQAHGAKYNDQYVGTFGTTSAYSFYPTKNMTTGEGGMILTKDKSIYENIQRIISHGQKERYLHTQLGYNFRMTNIAAALGIEQLNKLNDFNDKRKENAKFYNENIKNNQITLPFVPSKCDPVYHQYTVKVKNRTSFIKHLEENNIGYGIYYPIPLNTQPYYKELGYDPTTTPIALQISQEVVSIPVHPLLSKEEILKIIEVINLYE
ncbi:DegT/DnrJ/EryC1/StrS family aminotransferase [Inediibacterium massiliense]|uniref:DegT/DnrJ/EryC1/StrS family aminotransferase n=1 Tax=Inediibacterium massiliense TaxID=1658111 RepID=UPI0006B5FF2D|nr:DegT/DnrJ/EryC1/StrS family aminotransferase [Inediibacterium massiliense]